MKKELLLLFLLSLAPARANELIHDEWHPATDSFAVNGVSYSTSLVSQNTQLQVNFGSQYFIISNGTCQESDSLELCFPAVAVDYHNITLDEDVYKAKLAITEITAELTLSRTLEKTTLLMGEESDAELIIRNIGERPATDIYLEDAFFPAVDIRFLEGCLLSGTTIFWKGTLFPGQSQRCTFTIAAKPPASFPAQATLRYFDGFRTKNLSSSLVQITVPDHALRITPALSGADIGTPFNLTITLKNVNEEYPISVASFTLDIPPLLRLLSKPVTILRADKTLRWQGSLEPEQEQSFTIVLEGERNGTFIMPQDAHYLVNKIPQRLKADIPIAISVTEPKLVLTMPDAAVSGSSVPFQLTLSNPGSHQYDDVTVDVNGPLTAFFHAERLLPGTEEPIITAEFTAPEAVAESSLPLNITLGYKTPFGQRLGSSLSRSITITPLQIPAEEGPSPLPGQALLPEPVPEPLIQLQPVLEEPLNLAYFSPPWWVTVSIILLLGIDTYIAVSLIKRRKTR